MPAPHAFMPLVTYPEPVDGAAIQAALRLASAIGGSLTVVAYPVDIPQVSTPLGGMLLDLPGLARAAEDKSQADAEQTLAIVKAYAATAMAAKPTLKAHRLIIGGVNDAAVETARLHDLGIVPWSKDATAEHDVIQALVFGAGRPVVVVPASFSASRVDHIAIAWDGSRVAARALGDALPLLAPDGRVTVLTVSDEKPIRGSDPAGTLAAALIERGIHATSRAVSLGQRSIATALQEAAVDAGARLLAMGGFGHSRLRDFVLGGATTGVLADLRIATLLSH